MDRSAKAWLQGAVLRLWACPQGGFPDRGGQGAISRYSGRASYSRRSQALQVRQGHRLMSKTPPLRYITKEDGLTTLNATDSDGVLRKFILNPDQEAWIAGDLVRIALARRGYVEPPDLTAAYQTSDRKQGIA